MIIMPSGFQCALHNVCDGVQKFCAEPNAKLQKLIEKRINKARDLVFNHMPIRLLKFDGNGEGITLVE